MHWITLRLDSGPVGREFDSCHVRLRYFPISLLLLAIHLSRRHIQEPFAGVCIPDGHNAGGNILL